MTEELMTLIDRYAFFIPGSESSDLAREEVKRAIDLALQNTRDEALEDAAKICQSKVGGAVQSNDWWNGFRSAMRQCAEAIQVLKGK